MVKVRGHESRRRIPLTDPNTVGMFNQSYTMRHPPLGKNIVSEAERDAQSKQGTSLEQILFQHTTAHISRSTGAYYPSIASALIGKINKHSSDMIRDKSSLNMMAVEDPRDSDIVIPYV